MKPNAYERETQPCVLTLKTRAASDAHLCWAPGYGLVIPNLLRPVGPETEKNTMRAGKPDGLASERGFSNVGGKNLELIALAF